MDNCFHGGRQVYPEKGAGKPLIEACRPCLAFRLQPCLSFYRAVISFQILYEETHLYMLVVVQEVEDFAELRDVLSPTELLEMLASAHKPSYVSWRISTILARCSISQS